MYKSMDTTPPFSAKEGILFPNFLTFVHGIEVLLYVALSCMKLFMLHKAVDKRALTCEDSCISNLIFCASCVFHVTVSDTDIY